MHKEENGYIYASYEGWGGPFKNDEELEELYPVITRISLDLPPLPPLKLSPYEGWQGFITLPSWANCYAASTPEHRRTEGNYPLSFDTEEMPQIKRGYEGVPPSPAQIAAYEYLIENDETIRDAIFQAIFDQYPEWQDDYGMDKESMPDVTAPNQFESLLALQDVNIKETEKEGVAYIYLTFTTDWDPEHGLAAIVHKDRIIAAHIHDMVDGLIEEDVNECSRIITKM